MNELERSKIANVLTAHKQHNFKQFKGRTWRVSCFPEFVPRSPCCCRLEASSSCPRIAVLELASRGFFFFGGF